MRTENGKKKMHVTPTLKKAAEKGRRDIIRGKGISMSKFLVMALDHDARKHASRD